VEATALVAEPVVSVEQLTSATAAEITVNNAAPRRTCTMAQA
jgi:hypothetical protein